MLFGNDLDYLRHCTNHDLDLNLINVQNQILVLGLLSRVSEFFAEIGSVVVVELIKVHFNCSTKKPLKMKHLPKILRS